jgi:uncharacterized surface protein with fasciclin (FAS1) repeats
VVSLNVRKFGYYHKFRKCRKSDNGSETQKKQHTQMKAIAINAIGKLTPFVMAAVLMFGTFACTPQSEGTVEDQAPVEEVAPANDIVAVAKSAGTFNTLAAAVEAAGLAETLMGPGPYTVFAPTDEAFAKLPAGTVESLLLPENLEQLRAILLYHVVSGSVMAADVVTLNEATTVNGAAVTIAVGDAGVVLNGTTNVVTTDITASNGVIHVIDSVLMPPAGN